MAVVDDLHIPMDPTTLAIVGFVVGLLLLFGAWDVPSELIALIIAGAVLVYLSGHTGMNLEWET
ncbi:hypothetical protein HY994_00815 [Candidatus Micrarchaeota archaeon]|nr:hypothetical protein [Candidatus Micrarchaeota archaeon]